MNKFAIKKSLKPKKEFAKKEVYGIFQFFFFFNSNYRFSNDVNILNLEIVVCMYACIVCI